MALKVKAKEQLIKIGNCLTYLVELILYDFKLL